MIWDILLGMLIGIVVAGVVMYAWVCWIFKDGLW